MRKCLYLLAAALFIAGCAGVAEHPAAPGKKAIDPRGAGDFRFVVMGDTRPWWKGADVVTQNEHFLGNIRRANSLGDDFAVILGDLIHGYTDDADLVAKEWDAYDKMCKNFEMPVVPVIGNHDVWNKASEEVWRRRYGLDYLSFDHKGAHFIVLSSEIQGQQDRIAAEQLAWLKEDLRKAASARRTFVFLHAPLWAYPPKPGETANQWMREVHPLLAAAGVDTVFAGHWHRYLCYSPMGGVRYVLTGGGGAELDPYELTGGFFHFVEVSVKGRKAGLELVTADGRLPADIVTPDSVKAAEGALAVEPLAAVPPGGEITIRARLGNPTNREVRAAVTWDATGTFWRGEKAVAPTLAPNGAGVLEVRAKVGEKMFPLPKARVELVDGSRKLYGWDFLVPALAGVAPMVREWNVVGPFDLGLADWTDAERNDKDRYLKGALPGWNGTLPPEQGADLAAAYPGKGGRQVRWQAVKADQAGLVDLDAVFNDDYAVAYAVAYIRAPKAGKFYFTAGSDDSILVRINGKEVWRKHVQRAAKADEDVFSADLKEGWNEVLLKVADRILGWGFYFRVIDPERSLKFALKPEK